MGLLQDSFNRHLKGYVLANVTFHFMRNFLGRML